MHHTVHEYGTCNIYGTLYSEITYHIIMLHILQVHFFIFSIDTPIFLLNNFFYKRATKRGAYVASITANTLLVLTKTLSERSNLNVTSASTSHDGRPVPGVAVDTNDVTNERVSYQRVPFQLNSITKANITSHTRPAT